MVDDQKMKTKGLTFKEAIESGRPFRRSIWRLPDDFMNEKDLSSKLVSEILATDWEIQVEPDKLRDWTISPQYDDVAFNGPMIDESVTVIEKLPGYRMISRDEIFKALGKFVRSEIDTAEFLRFLGFDEVKS